MSRVRVRRLTGFDDPTFGAEQWQSLMRAHGVDIVYLTYHWQRAWWETASRGHLLLLAAERDGQVVALAPLYHQSGMVYFVASEFESDYLDFVGDTSDPAVLDALLGAARECVPSFVGFEFYFVPDSSGNGPRLQAAAARLGLSCYEEDDMLAPVLDLAGRPDAALAARNDRLAMRYERVLRRAGSLDAYHVSDGAAVRPMLEDFFDQHVERWTGAGNPSRFVSPKVRRLFERFTELAAATGWLRFSRLEWDGRTIAYHYGLRYGRRFFWGPACFARDAAKHSPGQVLLRHVVAAAIDEGGSTFDFGTGAAPFKARLATHLNHVRTWSMYLRSHGAAEPPVPDASDSTSTECMA